MEEIFTWMGRMDRNLREEIFTWMDRMGRNLMKEIFYMDRSDKQEFEGRDFLHGWVGETGI